MGKTDCFTQFYPYPVLPMGKTDCFTQFYPILSNWFYPLGKTTMPTLSIFNRFRDIVGFLCWEPCFYATLQLLYYKLLNVRTTGPGRRTFPVLH